MSATIVKFLKQNNNDTNKIELLAIGFEVYLLIMVLV